MTSHPTLSIIFSDGLNSLYNFRIKRTLKQNTPNNNKLQNKKEKFDVLSSSYFFHVARMKEQNKEEKLDIIFKLMIKILFFLFFKHIRLSEWSKKKYRVDVKCLLIKLNFAYIYNIVSWNHCIKIIISCVYLISLNECTSNSSM